ncbi:hypothetical protein ADUPG1_000770, partial [Aduncisulcus paluster]
MSELKLVHAIGYSGHIPNSVQVLPDKHVAYVLGTSVVIASLTDPDDQCFLKGHKNDIITMNISPNGRYLITGEGGVESDVCVWDLSTLKLKYTISEHDHGIYHVCFSGDGEFFASVGGPKDGRLIIYEMKTGYLVQTVYLPDFPITSVCFSPRLINDRGTETFDYRILAASERSLVSILFQPAKEDGITTTKLPLGSLHRNFKSMLISPSDPCILFGGTSSGDLLIIDIRSGTVLKTLPVCHGGICSIVCVSEGASREGRGGGTQEERRARRARGEKRTGYRSYGAQITTTLYISGGDGFVRELKSDDKIDWEETSKVSVSGTSVTSLSLDLGDNGLVYGTSDGTLGRINVATFTHAAFSMNNVSSVVGMGFLEDTNEIFVTVTADGLVRVWDC